MLVLSRRTGERINIGDGVVITLVSIEAKRVRVGIEAPKEISVRRDELDELTQEDREYQTLGARLQSTKGKPHDYRLAPR